jgi:uncharacterized protein
MERNIGILSDTHGLLRPFVLDRLKGCDLILHAGDIGSPDILELLQRTAPVKAVRGNTDTGAALHELPSDIIVEIDKVFVYMMHDIASMDIDPAAAGISVVVSGHSHVPRIEQRNGIFYVNPGSAGPKRFRLPVSMARMTINGGKIDCSLITIPQ